MLVELTGIAVSTDEAAHIKVLYNALDSFDKKKIDIKLKSLPELRGQFCRHRKAVHSHSELMARFILYEIDAFLLQVQYTDPFSLGIQYLAVLVTVE